MAHSQDEYPTDGPVSNRKPQNESLAALQAFEDYWNLGPKRSLAKLGEYYKKRADSLNADLADRQDQDTPQYKPLATLNSLESWSAAFDWQGRIRERMDIEREEQIRLAVTRRKDAAETRLKTGKYMQQAGLMVFSKADLEKLPVDEARKLLGTALSFVKEGMEIERRELGESTDNYLPVKPLHEMTDVELEEYASKLNLAAADFNKQQSKQR